MNLGIGDVVMKYLVLLADGMADYPVAELDGQTPLQVARTPNMDRLAAQSLIGLVKTIPDHYPPGSDVANMSVMGYDPARYYTGRSPLEAVSMGVKMAADDLALRCNLVTLSEQAVYADKTMLDYSAGEISSEESAQLMHTLQEELGNDMLAFYAGISYRHLLIWKKALGRKLKLTPPHDILDCTIKPYLPQGADYEILLELMQKSALLLQDHPVNIRRVEKGLAPANSIWLWGEGGKPSLSSFKEKYALNASVVCAVDLVRGLGLCAGMKAVTVNGATGGIQTNFAGKAMAAIKELQNGQDFVYLHIESPDEAGHQGNLKTKIWAIEQIDKEVVGPIMKAFAEQEDFRFMILPDHPTPLALRTHTRDPVPFMIFDRWRKIKPGHALQYNEETARQGVFVESGPALLDLFICS